jgi:hypothetical protein
MLNQLFEQVAGAILHHSNQQQETGFDPSNLLNHVQELFGQHAANTGQSFTPNIPAGFGNVRPASQDPYGDPADQEGSGRFGNIRPASQDPYGDPADR